MDSQTPPIHSTDPEISGAIAWRAAMGTTVLWLGVSLLLYQFVPDRTFSLYERGICVAGTFALWRNGWLLLNLGRAAWYNRWTYPRLRERCACLPERFPPRLHVVVTSYKELSDSSRRCFQSVIRASRRIDSEVIVVASVGSEEEADVIRSVVESEGGGIDLHFTLQKDGKRLAIGHALRFLRDHRRRLKPKTPLSDEVVLLMDGDSVLGETMMERCLPHFRLDRKMGGVTTNELTLEAPRLSVKRWYDLKFGKRHVHMSSHSLSRQVLTLTGRGSFVRANIAFSNDCIERIENDFIDHPIHGRIRFLMGDDKSTLFCVLKNGWSMLYVPDAWVYSMEDRDEGFIRLTTLLMPRWYGNMLRNNSRCLSLGPTRMPVFIWLCYLDQRISMWTSLVGPVGMLLLGVWKSGYLMLLWLSWIALTRLFQLWGYMIVWGRTVSPVMVLLLLYDQVVGSTIKVYTIFHLDRQGWSKGTEKSEMRGDDSWYQAAYNRTAFAVSLTLFVVFLHILLRIVPVTTAGL